MKRNHRKSFSDPSQFLRPFVLRSSLCDSSSRRAADLKRAKRRKLKLIRLLSSYIPVVISHRGEPSQTLSHINISFDLYINSNDVAFVQKLAVM